MKSLILGILAHVDAGKTTLSEAMLYTAGSIRKLGRVDNQDAFLDTDALERARGITIFSKQARLEFEERPITLLDTPGHVDFSAEMERTLQVLDCAILVISGADGVQGHTEILWSLLSRYRIPVFLFINKMDQPGTERQALLDQLKKRLSSSCLDFTDTASLEFMEAAAMCEEEALDTFLETGRLKEEDIRRLILERRLFPCFFGSALKLSGVEELLKGICQYGPRKEYPSKFGARVYKIARDEQGNRLSYLKVTGGVLKVKALLSNKRGEEAPAVGELWEEKVNQIRLYSGERFETVSQAEAGTVCAVTGLTKTYAGQGLGFEASDLEPVLEPVLNYEVKLPEGSDVPSVLLKLRQLEEEEPELHVAWDEHLKEIQVQLMGEVQVEVLKSLIEERFHIKAEFGQGRILYRETIADSVEGVGHFEPLRHYAEVHLLLEPKERGSGLELCTNCSEDMLDRNWQRLVLTHLEEKVHKGVLTGAPITDMRITLTAGKAHNKHTEGGDFRQATYRAVRQGLMQADSVLLEPWYDFRLELPQAFVGRAMTDIEKRGGLFTLEQSGGEEAILTGSAPVASMRGYQTEVTAYTKGRGRFSCSFKGYEPCHNAEEVIAQAGYDPDRDTENPSSSVFCSHGAGFVVEWDCVRDYMHIESTLLKTQAKEESNRGQRKEPEELFLGTEEIDAILERTFYANRRDKSVKRRALQEEVPVSRVYKRTEPREEYLLVDGYNIIFAWEELKELAETSLDGARGRLMDLLCNYQAVKRFQLILVFDAYRLEGHKTEVLDYHNIHVVYTREAETADQYIERFAHENGRRYSVAVATSDGLEQVIIRGQGCRLISARELKEDMEQVSRLLREEYMEQKLPPKNRLFDGLEQETLQKLTGIEEQDSD